jgi:hypothetical protein
MSNNGGRGTCILTFGRDNEFELQTIVEKMIGCQSFIWPPEYPNAPALRGSSDITIFLERVIAKAEA